MTFWVITLGVPTAAFWANVLVRNKLALPQSTGTDWLLLLMVIDFTAVLSASEFGRYLSRERITGDALGVFALLTILVVGLWLVTILYVEPNIHRKRRVPKLEDRLNLLQQWRGKLSSSNRFWSLLSWFTAFIGSMTNIYVFA